ncbi:MAG TPA: YceI family protein [Nocardioidaceae bacterium]|nr:YceI family protein [Nocardioidaceae bacterium]
MTTATLNNLSTLAGDYTLDHTHTRIGFVARHAMVTKVRGSFNEFSGTAHIDEDVTKSSVKLAINVDSIDTRNADRDGHLRTNDFLDIENHPQISFESTSVRQIDDLTVEVIGDLTIKGVSKPVAIEFEYQGSATDPFGNQRVGFEGSVVINRKDWGITWNAALETGGVLVSDKITLEFEISAVKNA